MAKFVAAKKVERIEWDFTGVPALGAQDDDRVSPTVGGDHVKGVLPEPDPDTVQRFAQAHEAIIEDALRAHQATISRFVDAQAGKDPDEDPVDPGEVGAQVMTSAAAYVGQYEQTLAALKILDIPTELLEQLPPRYLGAFLSYVSGELQGEGDAA